MSLSPIKIVAVIALTALGAITGISQEEIQTDREPPKTKKIAYLGVLSCPVDESLRQHLDLPEGFGLKVKRVLEDSPAAMAVLKPHDVLTKLDDQRLTSAIHLALLVRSYPPGETVELTILRKGTESVVELVLGEREVADQPFFASHPHLNNPAVVGHPAEWQHAVQCYQDSLNQWLQQSGQRPDKHQQGVQPSTGNVGKPPAISIRPGFPIQVFGSKGIVKIDNGFGEVTIEATEEGHQITVKDENGTVVHEGDYDAEKGTDGLPEEAQAHLKKMKLDDLKILIPAAPVMNPPAGNAEDNEPNVEKISEPIPGAKNSNANHKSELL